MFTISNMTVNFKQTPLGIDSQELRFGWLSESEETGWLQKQYRISIATTQKGLYCPDIWDSGIVESGESIAVWNQNCCLKPCTQYFWRVTVTSESGETQLQDSFFETGVFDENFEAKWIMHPRPRPGWAVYFRKSFAAEKDIDRVRAYFSGLGAGELYVNGEKIGDHLIDPPFTNYEKIVLYNAYDITSKVRKGENALGVLLGDGWYHQNRVWANGGFSYGDCRMLLEVHIYYKDGTMEKILSDESFLCDYSPITLNNIYGGETYDARLEQDGWCQTDFNAEGWVRAVKAEPPGGRLVCSQMPPVRVTRKVQPKKVERLHKGSNEQVFIFDMGENFAGFVRIHIPFSPAGSEYVLRFAEEVDEIGGLLYTSTGSEHTYVLQQDRYISKGSPDGEVWEPRFTYHGFRYVEVTGLYGREMPDGFLEGLAVNTDLQCAGQFICSDERMNKLQELSQRTILSNYHGFPEDCPIRERCGWLGDAQLVSEAAIYNFDMAAAYEKYLEDIRTTKEIFGTWMMIAPGKRVCHRATPIWASAQIIIPWNLYLYYNDTCVLRRYYPLMKELVQHYVNDQCINYILHFGLGDWCPPGGNNHNPHRIPIEVSSTAELYHMTVLMEKIASILGEEEDRHYFSETAHKVKEAFNEHYFDPVQNSYGTQGADGAALYFGLCPEGKEKLVADDAYRLLIEKCGGGMSTGIWGNKYLIPAMTEYGYGDAMMSMLWNLEKTSFGTMLRDGATSVWECLETPPATGAPYSLNHPMHISFTSWFYSHILGLTPDEEAPGFKKFSVCPFIFGGITSASGYHQTIYGCIKIAWRLKDDCFELDLTVPANTQAECYIPAGSSVSVKVNGQEVLSDVSERIYKGQKRLFAMLGAGDYQINCKISHCCVNN